MAELNNKQAKTYAEIRLSYPLELFQFIASHTPSHLFAWDVGTDSAKIYKNVVATDMSTKPLEFAPYLPNVQYKHTSPTMSISEVEQKIVPKASLDLVTAAQALHWLNLPSFYQQVNWVLKNPHGVITAWCYTEPKVNSTIDAVFQPFYAIDSWPFWDLKVRKVVDDEYRTIDFPFEPMDGLENTGPVEFVYEKIIDLDQFFAYIRSWSVYQTAKDKGFELLRKNVIERFECAWSEDGNDQKVVKFPVHMNIGRVGNI